MSKEKSVFEQLSALNLSSKTEKRGNLTYLSWAHAWSECKKLFPDMTRTVYESETGMNYFTDGSTAWVKVGVTIQGQEHIDYLPVMDMRNQSVPLANITSMQVNKTIQRSTVKALALHGLALNIYAKEDFPSESDSSMQAVKPQPKSTSKVALVEGDANWEKVSNFVIDNMGMSTDEVIKKLSVKYDISEVTKKAINKLRK
jgi:hypothetical protein